MTHYAIIEACEPEALPAPTADVDWETIPDSQNDRTRSSGCPLVHIRGTRDAIVSFLGDHWGIDEVESASFIFSDDDDVRIDLSNQNQVSDV